MTSPEMDALVQEVTDTTGVEDSAIAFIAGLEQQIRDLTPNPAAIQALADSLAAKRTALAAALVVNP